MGTKTQHLYGAFVVNERHRHRYEFNNTYRAKFEEAGMIFCGTSPDGKLVEIIELRDHPFFIASQFHPEFQSKPNKPHPLFMGFIALDDVDAAAFEHGAGVATLEAVHGEGADLVLDSGSLARQKARAHPPSGSAEAQIEARRLQLLGLDRRQRLDLPAVLDQTPQVLGGQQPGRMGAVGRLVVGVFGEQAGGASCHAHGGFPRAALASA
jgi:hypothetical protein